MGTYPKIDTIDYRLSIIDCGIDYRYHRLSIANYSNIECLFFMILGIFRSEKEGYISIYDNVHFKNKYFESLVNNYGNYKFKYFYL